jgi:hypothetical protein
LQAALATATGVDGDNAIKSILSSASSALGTVGSAISTFSSNLNSARKQSQTASAAQHKADVTLAKDQADQKKLLTETGIAYGVLAQAQARYNSLSAQSDAVVKQSTANRDAAKKQLDSASAALNGFKTVQQQTSQQATDALQTLTAAKTKYDALASSGTKSTSAVSKQALADAKAALHDAQTQFDHFSRELDSASKKTATALARMRDASRSLKTAQHELDVASDPATFTKNLNAQTAAGDRFAKNIAKLTKEGFVDLAKQLAAEGPEAAGALAAGFAGSKAKAKAAESAIDHANSFAVAYQSKLEQLFGPGGGAVTAAGTAGAAIGEALTQGLKVTVGSGVGEVVGQAQQQLARVQLTPKSDLTPGVRTVLGAPQKAIPPVAFGAPVQVLPLSNPAVAPGGPSRLALDLTIVLDDGRTVHAQTEVPVPQGRSLSDRVVAEVHAS